MSAPDRPADDLAAACVGYREHDGGPVEYRVDLIDLKTTGRPTVASLTPEEAYNTAGSLMREALRARLRSTGHDLPGA